MKIATSVFVGLIALAIDSCWAGNLEEKYAWSELKFDWPSKEAEQEAITSGRYVPANNLPLGIEVWRDKLFVTVPRWKSGVAASLNYIQLPTDEKSPVLRPYPSWEDNNLPIEVSAQPVAETAAGRAEAKKPALVGEGLKLNSSIVSTFRVRADECNRLWVMDTGLADILGNPNQVAPPAIVIFDLETNQLIRRFTCPESVIKEDTFFANIVVDVSKHDCDNAYAYIPDLGAYSIVVYSFKDNKAWRVKHNFFHFDPLNGDYNVGGVNFQWTDGVFGLAVGNEKTDGSRDVYFHALSSTKEFAVSNKVLQNETYSTSPDCYYEFKLLGDRGANGQSSAEFFDKDNEIVFYTQVNKDGVGCWNAKKPYNQDTQGLVDSDSTALVFPNDLKVDQDGYLWVLSDRMPAFIYQSLKPEEVNYRILRGKTRELIRGTPCDIE